MSLTKDDLDKISANTQAIVDLAVARLEHRLDIRFERVFDELRSLKNDIESVKTMLTEDVAGAYERIDELEARVKQLERQVAVLV